MSIPIAIHLLAALIWVGGMFFALVMVRPAALELDTEHRVRLWMNIMNRFIHWIWGAVIALPVTGYWMLYAHMGGMEYAGTHILIMQIVGWMMIALFLFVFFVPYQGMRRMFDKLLMPEAGLYMEWIRTIMSINLLLGIGVILVAVTGRFW